MKIFEVAPPVKLSGFNNQGSSNNTEAFLQDYYDNTSEHPFNARARVYDNSVLQIYPMGNKIHVSDVLTLQPRSGSGTKAMQFLKALSDKHRVKLDLTAKAYSSDNKFVTDTEQLVRWYSKLGFEIDDEFIDDIDDLEGVEEVDMIYHPK